MKEKDVDFVLDEEQIGEWLYTNLIAQGLVPEQAELETLASLVFDYVLEFMAHLGVGVETFYEDDED